MKVLVLGASGLLGSSLTPYFINENFEVITHSSNSNTDFRVDLSNKDETIMFLSKINPDLIINLVGMTDVDKCEIDINLAYKLNVKSVENIVSYLLSNTKCHLVHISTDQVYDGIGLQSENDISLKNYYAFSKYAGEIVARSVKSTILRTNFFGKSFCKNRSSITDWIVESIENKRNISAFEDVYFNPLSMSTLSKIILEVSNARIIGTFNLGAHEPLSKADFIFKFSEILNLNTSLIKRISISDATNIKTYRPKNMQMDCRKIEMELKFKLPKLYDELLEESKNYVKTK